MQLLEFHIYETNWMLHKGKYKTFIAQSEKLLIQSNELPIIQLQIQLIRRLLYCRLKVLSKHFIKFNTKQSRILSSLDKCMQLIHIQNNHIIKCQDVLTNDCQQQSIRKQKYKQINEMQSPRTTRFKQYIQELENEPWNKKSIYWLKYQEQELFVSIQQILMFNYLYFKMTNLKESIRFLHKLIQLHHINTQRSINIYNKSITLLNSAYFELSYTFKNQLFDSMSQQLIEYIREYYRPNSNQQKCKRLMKEYTQIIIINLDLYSKSLEYKDKYVESANYITMADYLSQHILQFIGNQNELIKYISDEYDFKHEKYEQIIIEQQDLNRFVSYLYNLPKYNNIIPKQHFIPKFNVQNDQIFICKRRNSEHLKQKELFNSSSTLSLTQQLNSPQSTNRLNSPQSTNRLNIRRKNKHNESRSYLSKLINLRNLSQHQNEQKNVETQLQKHLRQLQEKLIKFEKPNNFQSIDKVFAQKIEAITFEKCLTLDQVKETAKKIIAAEWEVHKEMPVTKSLMKSISVSDIQLVAQEQFNKLQEYIELEKKDYHNSQKDKAQTIMKENEDFKKLQQNQQKYQMKMRHQKVQQQLQIPNKLLSLQTDETGLSPKFIKRNTQLMNQYSTTIFDRVIDPKAKQTKEFSYAQKQLMDLMVQNLEQRDELNQKKVNVRVLPKSITRIPSPTDQLSQSDNKKSFAFSNNSTRLEITKF